MKMHYTTGELAQRLNTTLRTLRFYEKEGLITPVVKGSRPRFDESTYYLMRRIFMLKETGLSLKEIKEVINRINAPTLDGKRMTLALRETLLKADEALREKEQSIAVFRAGLQKTLTVTSCCADCEGGNKPGVCDGCGKLSELRKLGI